MARTKNNAYDGVTKVPIIHQLHNKDFYDPTWEIKHLFLGTFNPMGGDPVNYYYGRERNMTWPLLSAIFNTIFNPLESNFLELIKENGIACLDVIHNVMVPENRQGEVLKGYKDSAIVNSYVQREYNTDRIRKIIEKNSGVKIYSTWGEGPQLKEWITEIAQIENIIPLTSPSMAAPVPEGQKKFETRLAEWKSIILLD